MDSRMNMVLCLPYEYWGRKFRSEEDCGGKLTGKCVDQCFEDKTNIDRLKWRQNKSSPIYTI